MEPLYEPATLVVKVEMNDKAQIHTLEGFAAATLMTFTSILIAQSSLIITPQSELSMDVQLKQIASDALSVLDTAPGTALPQNLTICVGGWNRTEATLLNNSLQTLEYETKSLLPADVIYNMDFAYVENNTLVVKRAIIHGSPVDNPVVATRLVTLFNSTITQSWNISPGDVRVVEVRLIAWRV